MPVLLKENDLDALRSRILHAFGERARELGLRSVVMAELARELGISSKTLYRCFPTKDHLVQALIDRWVDRLAADDRSRIVNVERGAQALLREWGDAWVQSVQRFSPAFWTELERDNPQAYETYAEAVRKFRDSARRSFAPEIRPSLSSAFAQALFAAIVRTAADPGFCERLGMTRRDTVRAAIDVWATGALDPARQPRHPARSSAPAPIPLRRRKESIIP